MTWDEFTTQMNRMVETFGANAYKRERAQLIFGEVKDLNAPVFSRIVNKFICESRQAPLVPDFKEAATQVRMRAHDARKNERVVNLADYIKRPDCGVCQDSGAVMATLRDNPIGLYAFSCSCRAGAAKARNFPAWEGSISKDYERYTGRGA